MLTRTTAHSSVEVLSGQVQAREVLPYDRLRSGLQGALLVTSPSKHVRRAHRARCPVCQSGAVRPGKCPALDLAESHAGAVLLRCHNDCPPMAVFAALGVNAEDFYPDPASMASHPERRGADHRGGRVGTDWRAPESLVDGVISATARFVATVRDGDRQAQVDLLRDITDGASDLRRAARMLASSAPAARSGHRPSGGISYDQLLARLHGPKPSTTPAHGLRAHRAYCPVHQSEGPRPGRTRSLSVTESQDRVILITCFAGCHIDAITGAVGVTPGALFPGDIPGVDRQLDARPTWFTVAGIAKDLGDTAWDFLLPVREPRAVYGRKIESGVRRLLEATLAVAG